MRRRVRHPWIWIAALSVAAFAAVRIVQMATGALAVATGTGEVALVIGLPSIVAIGMRLLRDERIVTRLLAAVLLCWIGIALVAPLWQVSHPPSPIFQGRLGGGDRETITAAPPRTDRYELRIARLPHAEREVPRNAYTLHLLQRGAQRTFVGTLHDRADTTVLNLIGGEPVTLHLPLSDEKTEIILRRQPPSRALAQWGALIAVILAALVDGIALRRIRWLRGVLAGSVGALALFVALFDPEVYALQIGTGGVPGRTALALSALALSAGSLGGALLGWISGSLITTRSSTRG